jgi:hypothetical protein
MLTRKLSSSFSSNGVQEWRNLYVAALFETDLQKLPSRIAEAERALMKRADEVLSMSGNNCKESQALDDALYALRALSNCFELSPRGLEAA